VPRVEQAADMHGVVTDPKSPADDRRHASAGPELPPEAIGFGAPMQERRQMSPLFGGQAAGRTGVPTSLQGLGAARAGTLHPLADGPLADAEGVGDPALGPAPLLELPSLAPPDFFPIVGYRVHAWQFTTGCPCTLVSNVLVSKSY
jgi:hypothetical protein